MVSFEDTFFEENDDDYEGISIKGLRREKKRSRQNSKNPLKQQVEYDPHYTAN